MKTSIFIRDAILLVRHTVQHLEDHSSYICIVTSVIVELLQETVDFMTELMLLHSQT